MTFDFAPGWLEALTVPADCTPPRPLESAMPATALPRAKVLPCAPAHPTLNQMADLVGELFTEGSLSFEQLCSISNDPDMEPLLGDRIAGVAPARRAASAG